MLKRVSWEVLGRRLYETIFEEAPFLESMFDRSALTMGIKLVDMIDSIVGALDDPAAVHRKMEGLGGVHHRHGVRALEHMPVFHGVVVKLLGEALGADLTDEVAEAWHWLWGWLTESMLVVERAYGERSSLIQQSWDAVTENLTTEEIGSAVYEALFEVRPGWKQLDAEHSSSFIMHAVYEMPPETGEACACAGVGGRVGVGRMGTFLGVLGRGEERWGGRGGYAHLIRGALQMAPNLQGLFTKPKAIMAVKLVNIVGLLISISASPTILVEIMRDVGVRHVVYGVAPHHLPVQPPRRPRVCTAVWSQRVSLLGAIKPSGARSTAWRRTASLSAVRVWAPGDVNVGFGWLAREDIRPGTPRKQCWPDPKAILA